MTPVAPHLTSSSSVVLGESSEVVLRVEGGRPAVAVMDGVAAGLLAPGGELSCRLAKQPARLIALRPTDLAAALRPVLAPPPLT